VIELVQRRGSINAPALTVMADMMEFSMRIGTRQVETRIDRRF
jgi:hypothetical protein